MRYEITTLSRLIAACWPLMEASDAETGADCALEVDRGLYRVVDQTTQSFGAIVWDEDKPIGMAGIIVAPDPHHGRVTAANETIFVLPEYRKSLVPARLFKLCEQEAKRRGAVRFQWTAFSGSAFERSLEKRRAYRRQETLFIKEL